MNLSSCWPTTVWLQLRLCPYQVTVDCCNLFSCNGEVVLCACWHISNIVAIMVIVIVKWHWYLDAFNDLTTLILALGVMLGVWSCVTRWRKSVVAQSLCWRSSAPSDISCMWNMLHCCFFPPPMPTIGTRVDCYDDFGHKHGIHLVVLWALPRLVAINVNAIWRNSWGVLLLLAINNMDTLICQVG